MSGGDRATKTSFYHRLKRRLKLKGITLWLTMDPLILKAMGSCEEFGDDECLGDCECCLIQFVPEAQEVRLLAGNCCDCCDEVAQSIKELRQFH